MHYRRLRRTGDLGPPEPIVRIRSMCQAPECNREAEARGYCHGHYLRLQRTGVRSEEPLRVRGRLCSVDGCERPHQARGFCAAHDKRFLATGDPMPGRPIRKAAGVGTTDRKGYNNVPVPHHLRHLTGGVAWVGKHRLVMAIHLGRPLLADEVVHHSKWGPAGQPDREPRTVVHGPPQGATGRRPTRLLRGDAPPLCARDRFVDRANLAGGWQSRWDSNPRFRLERPASLASGRRDHARPTLVGRCSGGRTRTLNNRARTCRVTYYTTPERAHPRAARGS